MCRNQNNFFNPFKTFTNMNKHLLSLALCAFLLSLFAENTQAQASGVKPELIMYRHNGGNITPAPVITTNILGTLKWNGLTAIGNIQTGASIKSVVTGPVSTGVLPSNMIFSTQGFGGLRERMVITSSGLVGIGFTSPAEPLYHLDVVGNIHTSGRFYGRIHFDNNATDDLPSTYLDEAYFERKVRSQIGLGANTYTNGGILSLAPGGGSLDRQLFTGGDDGLWTRSQNLAGTDAWAAWEKILTSGDINGTPNRIARFLPPGPTSSKLGDSQLFDDGAQVGIGTTTPTAGFLLTVNGNSIVNGNLRATGNATVDGNASITGDINVSTNASVNGHANINGNAQINGNVGIGKAATLFDLDVAGQTNFDGRVKIGANNFPNPGSYELAVGGGVIAEEVLVQLEGAWPDYVFSTDYALKPLSEVATFIATEKHLPGVVSAKEVAEKGLDLGEMQKSQMEKIEELYLHLIAMDQKLAALKAENSALKAKMEQLEARN